MKQYIFKAILFCIGLLLIDGCLDPYNPSTTTANPSYLVVEGFLNTTTNSCTIKLSHSIPLKSDTAAVPPLETKAKVRIEDDNGVLYPLNETNKGEYTASNLTLNASKHYRIRIITTTQKQYLSDFVPVVQTPPIDSITYGNERTGLRVSVNTHDSKNNTRYYQWRYTETWVYEAAFDSELVLKDGQPVPRPESFYRCWKTVNSIALLLGSSAKLQSDIINNFNLTIVPWQSPKLRLKYSILAEQHSLTKDGYEYWLQVKKNTEALGTLFDPLPSRVTGNIQCVSNSEEPVMGYFSAGSTQQKRIFIESKNIKRPLSAPAIIRGYEQCVMDSVFFESGIHGELLAPITDKMSPRIIGYIVSSAPCVDCRFAGGTTVKPDFWQ